MSKNDTTYDVAVIGSGPGGYVAAIRAAQLGLKTVCIEKDRVLGGTCLNVGCIPSKTLLHATELYSHLQKDASGFGIQAKEISCNLSQMMERKQKIVTSFNQGISFLFKKNNITALTGTARLTSPTTIAVGGQEITARNIILATGSEPIPLPFLPFDEKRILSSTGALALDIIPKKMAIVGAGVIGVELGSVYKRLGSEVIFIEFLDRICPTFDPSLSKALQEALTKQGMKFHLSSKVIEGVASGSEISLTIALPDQTKSELSADVVLVSIGRRPYTQGLGLEKVGIIPNKGFIPIDGQFRTSVPSIFAIGDIVDGPMLAHKASEEGIAVAEIIAGHAPVIDYLTIPNVIYTAPEVAAVGLTETEAKQMGIEVKTGQFPFKANSRARCTGEEEGFVKVIADAKSDRIIGVHIISAHASELIAEGVTAIKNKMTALDLGNMVHAHPTLSESIKEACLAVHKRPIHL